MSEIVLLLAEVLIASCVFPQRLFLLEEREQVTTKTEDPGNAVEFQHATLAWERARGPAGTGTGTRTGTGGGRGRTSQKPKTGGGMRRFLRREKLSLYIIPEEGKGGGEAQNDQHLLTHMEQESPQSTVSSNQSIRPPLNKTLHRIHLHVRKVEQGSQLHVLGQGYSTHAPSMPYTT